MPHHASTPELWHAIDQHISQITGHDFKATSRSPLGGGCINTAFHIRSADRGFFVKTNAPDRLAMFEAESAGLGEMLASATLKTPIPLCHGATSQASYLVLEFLALQACSMTAFESLGRQLAGMHFHTASQFGWHIDNTIGATPQRNTPGQDWIAFWRDERIAPQLGLLSQRGIRGKLQTRGEILLARIERFFPGYSPVPSLLHGDLWSGNCAMNQRGEPVVYDPAVYYGDRECDLAMSELFGGFPERFYAAYRESYPLDPGYGVRKTLYNLYHILNHANLFGGGYVAQAERMLDKLLSEVH